MYIIVVYVFGADDFDLAVTIHVTCHHPLPAVFGFESDDFPWLNHRDLVSRFADIFHVKIERPALFRVKQRTKPEDR